MRLSTVKGRPVCAGTVRMTYYLDHTTFPDYYTIGDSAAISLRNFMFETPVNSRC